jgi:hypothetical protein
MYPGSAGYGLLEVPSSRLKPEAFQNAAGTVSIYMSEQVWIDPVNGVTGKVPGLDCARHIRSPGELGSIMLANLRYDYDSAVDGQLSLRAEAETDSGNRVLGTRRPRNCCERWPKRLVRMRARPKGSSAGKKAACM